MPGWKNSNRRATLPSNWQHEIVPRILRRDHLCQWGSQASDRAKYRRCTNQSREVDHIGSNLDHSDRNLRGLCTRHHSIKSGRQGNAVSSARARERAAARLRPQEKHPSEYL